MNKDPRVYLEDILESIAKIEEYTTDIDEAGFCSNDIVTDAVLRRLEIIGEAVKKMPTGMKERHPDIPWKKISGLRDILIHEYFGVNMKRVWKVVTDNLPVLKETVTSISADTP